MRERRKIEKRKEIMKEREREERESWLEFFIKSMRETIKK